MLNTTDLILRVFWFYALVPVCAVAPGWVVLHRLKLRPLERLVASIGVSLILLYLVSMTFFWTHAPRGAYYVAALACFCAAIGVWRSKVRVSRRLRSIVSGYALLVLWLLLLLLLVRNYSGGVCSIDWLEHYRRASLLLDPPVSFDLSRSIIAENTPMTARPPLMNAVAAFFLALTGDRYELFQAMLSALNLLFWFPLVMMLPWLGAGHRSNRTILLLFLMASPMVIWNATWTWTKLFTAFYVILGLAFYLEGWRRFDAARMALAFLFLTAGFLSHFSAGPYLLFLGVHYVLFLLPRRSRLWGQVFAPRTFRRSSPGGRGQTPFPRRIDSLKGWQPSGGAAKKVSVPWAPIATMILCLALLASWFGYAVRAAGPRAAFGSSTTAQAFTESSAGKSALRIAKNTVYSIIPHPLHVPRKKFEEMLGYGQVHIFNGEERASGAEEFPPANGLGYLRDYLLSIYGATFTFALGSVGGLLALWLIFHMSRAHHLSPDWRFGWTFAIVTAWIGIAAHPSLEEFGVAQICGQPLILLGLGFVASRYLLLPRMLRYVGLAGCAIDFILAGFIHVTMEMENPKVTRVGSLFRINTDLSLWAWFNARAKYAMSVHFLGDYFHPLSLAIQIAVLAFFAAVWWQAARAAASEGPVWGEADDDRGR